MRAMRPIAIKNGLRRNCLCVGSSAMFLYIAHNHPQFWYLSLIAFVPFLWRLLQVNLWGTLCLATTLGTIFVLATESRMDRSKLVLLSKKYYVWDPKRSSRQQGLCVLSMVRIYST